MTHQLLGACDLLQGDYHELAVIHKRTHYFDDPFKEVLNLLHLPFLSQDRNQAQHIQLRQVLEASINAKNVDEEAFEVSLLNNLGRIFAHDDYGLQGKLMVVIC